MAYVSDPLQEEQDEQGLAPMGAPSPVASAPGLSPQKPTSSGSFTDIRKYLSTNQPQSEQMGQKVAQGLGDRINQANQALDTNYNQFQNSLQAPAMTSEQVEQAATDPVKFAGIGDNVKAFQSALTGSFQGPQSLADTEGYQGLLKTIGAAQERGKLVDSAGGRQELIKDIYRDPSRAKTGLLSLDEALITQTPSALKPLQDQKAQAEALSQNLKTKTSESQKLADDARKAVESTRKQIQDRFLGESGAYKNFRSALDSKLESARGEAQKQAQEAKNYLDYNWLSKQGAIEKGQGQYGSGETFEAPFLNEKKLNISDGALGQLGISRDQYLDLVKHQVANRQNYAATAAQKGKAKADEMYSDALAIDPLSYLSLSSPEKIQVSNVASADDVAYLDALGSLLGDQVDTGFINRDSVGKLDNDITDFRYSELLDYLRAQSDPRSYVTKR